MYVIKQKRNNQCGRISRNLTLSMDCRLTAAIVMVLTLLMATVLAQTPVPSTATPNIQNTSPKPRNPEQGVFFSTFGGQAQLRHLPVIPYYENFNGAVPGIFFSNPNIHFLSTDFDYKQKTVYLYDYHLRSIAIGYNFTASLDVERMSFDFMHAGVSRGTVQVAVDWLSHMVYWTDPVFQWILAAPGDPAKVEKDYYKIIHKDHLDKPDGIAVDPLAGLLFWSDNGRFAKIERSTLTGANRTTLRTNVLDPMSLEADWRAKRIYWIDELRQTIESTDYDGNNWQLTRRMTNTILFDLAIYKDLLIVTEVLFEQVHFLNKSSGSYLANSISFSPEVVYGVAIYQEDNQPPRDKDYCKELQCEQLCFTTATGAICECSVGYIYNQSTMACEESVGTNGFHKALVVGNQTELCLLDIRSLAHFFYDLVCIYTVKRQPEVLDRSKRQTNIIDPTQMPTPPPTMRPSTPAPRPPIADPMNYMKMFEVNSENRIVYIVTADNTIYSRDIDLTIDSFATQPILVATGNISGLVYDWIDSDLYWSEEDTGKIYRVNVKDMAQEQVINQLTKPTELVLLPHQRKLAWISGMGTNKSIQSVGLDGTGLKTVITGRNFTSLTVDQHYQKFYWIETNSKAIYSTNFDGTLDRSLVTSLVDRDNHNMILYKDYLAWVYNNINMSFIKTYSISSNTSNAHGYLDIGFTIHEIKILDTDMQPADKSPCRDDNGQCSQICLTTHEADKPTTECRCTLGYKLVNKTMCVFELVKDNFALVTDRTHDKIYQVDLTSEDIHAFETTDFITPSSVFFDPIRKNIFWSALNDVSVYVSSLNMSQKLYANLGYMEAFRFAMDETSGDLYFGSNTWGNVGMVTHTGEVLDLFDLELGYKFSAIAVFPSKGWLFYAAQSLSIMKSSYIGRTNMDGTASIKLIQNSDVVSPTGLTIDYTNEYLYWCDQYTDKIKRCNLNGQNCTDIYLDFGSDLMDITTDGDNIYYIGWNRPHIGQVNLQTLKKSDIATSADLGRLDSLTIYKSTSKNFQPKHNKCADNAGRGDCSTICLPSPTGHVCKCNNDTLKPDGKTCSNVYQCATKFLLFGTMSIVQIDEACSRYFGVNCSFHCPSGYLANSSYKAVTCISNGWKEEEKPDLCIEAKCPQATIPNGQLEMTCSREIGANCALTCTAGFVAKVDSLVCTQSLAWNTDVNTVCKAVLCPKTLANGEFSAGCTFKAGTSCGYTCASLYKPNPVYPQLSCQTNGTWNLDTSKACMVVCNASQFECGDGTCIDKAQMCDKVAQCVDKTDETHPDCVPPCPETYPKAILPNNCLRKVNSTCGFQCEDGYYNTTSFIACSSKSQWQPSGACVEILCPERIDQGMFSSCSRKPGSSCEITCVLPYVPRRPMSLVQCLVTGQWNMTKEPCILSANQSSQTGGASNSVKVGVGVGVAVLALVIVAVLLAFIIFKRRGGLSSEVPYANASAAYTNDGNVQIENPYYMREELPKTEQQPQPDTNMNAEVDPSNIYMSMPAPSEYSSVDDGIVNPLYMQHNQEAMAASSDITNDSQVLTTDSWLKEMAKGPDK